MRKKGPQGHALRYWKSPIGWIGLAAGEEGLIDVVLGRSRSHAEKVLEKAHPRAADEAHPVIEDTLRQLREYFAGTRRRFDLNLDFREVSPFARTILEALSRSEFGTTLSYGQLAELSGRPGAARAVGGVMAANRWPVIIPCHRVVGCGGKLTGYSGGRGLATKEWLLRFEESTKSTRQGDQEREE